MPKLIGTAPNQVPVNGNLGNLAYQDAANIAGPVGVGGALTLNSGTANGVTYLNASKALTSGTALVFDGANLGVGTSSPIAKAYASFGNSSAGGANRYAAYFGTNSSSAGAAPSFGLAIGWNASGGGGESTIVYGIGAGSSPALAFASSDGTTQTERARISSTGQMSTTDGTGAVALAYDARAWVIFNGTGTIAILASGNVSSITDGGAGTYTMNFTTAMPDANYNAVGMSDRLSGTRTTFVCKESTVATTTSAFRFGVFNTGNSAVDSTFVAVSIFR